ncbi:MAG: oligoendopeptidase F [Clostridia bacterium]|nr:oligoendopeptidase F [Clostridia bacterium]
MNKIPKRNEADPKYTWDLSVLFADDDAWKEEHAALKDVPAKVAAFCGKLNDAKTLLAYFQLCDELNVRLSKFYGYAACKSDEDTGNTVYQDLKSKAFALLVEIESAGAFAKPEIVAIPDEQIDAFYKEEPALETYRRDLYLLRRMADHTLSGECEKLLATAGEIADAPEAINSVFHDAELKFDDVTDNEGNAHVLSNASFVPLLESPDREFRSRVFDAYYRRLGSFKHTVAAAVNAQFKQLRFFADARRYPSTLEAALHRTEVPVAVYKNLIEAVHQNLDKMYRYVSLRKKLLGTDDVHMYDVYTPVVPDAAKTVGFEEAKKTVLEALSVLGEDYTALLKKGFDERWIDVYENEGKRGGAYSSGNAYPHPFVLLNHKDNLDSLFTLAHEMGHALHSWHSCQYQPVNTADYVIFVAEVASTCNEILLMRYLLSHTDDKKQKAYLINHFLDQFKGTVYRQTMFAEFEMMMGEMSEAGETLTADLLNEKYLALNTLYYGPEMVQDKGIELEWARIPHFFYNYYVFQYATGFSAAAAIADRILTLGEPAVKDYKKFLSGGCSADPITLLKIAGVDMSTPDPVNAGLKLFGELIDEMEKLCL